jgi:transposase
MAKSYSTEKAWQKLGVSQATLARWLREARNEELGDKIKPQKSVDGRERLYTLEQLRWLAKRNGVKVLSDEQAFGQGSPGDLASLKKEVERLRGAVEELQLQQQLWMKETRKELEIFVRQQFEKMGQ